MEIRFYNTLSKGKEVFHPQSPGEVKIYNCGVTVYDKCHLGHARGAINFDVLRRFLKRAGYEVTYVKNYTDIDDKIIQRANELKRPFKALTEEMIQLHDIDMESLGIDPPDLAPKATDHLPEIIEMIQKILTNEKGYVSKGDVFFKVRQFPGYGKLSGKNIDDLIVGARVALNEDKEEPLDFALWKAAKPDEPTWDSPWGPGRPGWHIECSAMCNRYLGMTLDIHAGGGDLIFPHHENEIAQSESAHGKTFAKYWMHNGMIKIEGQKMSKSLGNFALISELVARYHPELIRFFILSTQYRQSVDFSHEALIKSAEGLDRIYSALEKYELQTVNPSAKIDSTNSEIDPFKERFMEALADDLNTPQAMAVLFELAKSLNRSEADRASAKSIYNTLVDLGSILGILETRAIDWFKHPRIDRNSQELPDQEIDKLILEREAARVNKDWSRADEIRDQLVQASIVLEDREGKTFWKRK